ncbi:MAG: acetate kinase AckA [Rhodobacteraceae bacterium HLUCCA12]|nr:MAG: acetate kinase AckA [Rhodobacteraceae bacterium HLUCCA12]
MRVLVFNAGSSSLKFGVFDTAADTVQRFKGGFERFHDGQCDFRFRTDTRDESGHAPHADLDAAIAAVPDALSEWGIDGIQAIGHRIVHGGPDFAAPTLLDAPTLAQIDALTPLAPLHNPAGLQGVRLAMSIWPDLPQVGVFDTAFHLTNPARATTYAVPPAWRKAGLRRYGFHGTSHKYVAQRAAQEIGQPLVALKIVSVHLGNGASVCAVNLGQSMDSSMGLTPLEGLVMGTRSGDVDPGAFGFLSRQMGLTIEEIEHALYHDSGLRALAGSSDMRDVEASAGAGDTDAQLAINLYAYRARKYIGAYAAAMGGLDAVVFTGGIGENSASMRRRICDGLDFLGLSLDHDRNETISLEGRAAPQIQAYGSRVRVLVTETAEQYQIAREVVTALERDTPLDMPIPIAVSGRHVHLSSQDVEALFGPGYRLTPDKPLRQPGNWSARERIAIEGPNGRIDHVAILGPTRPRTQIEVSRTDAFTLGIDAPVRDSGQLDGTPHVRLHGPAGSLQTDGLIVAARHIHISPAEAAARGLSDGDYVDVRVTGVDRGLTFTRTLVRVQPDAFTEMHIDTDEANAAGIRLNGEGALVQGVHAQAVALRD